VTVVADTTPLNYLILLGEVELLERLYPAVLIPRSVHTELASTDAPQVVQSWVRQSPAWVEVRDPQTVPHPLAAALHAGERDVITLALETPDSLVLLDERLGRRACRMLGLSVTGTVGILMNAGWQGLLDFETALRRLAQTTYRAGPTLFSEARARYACGPVNRVASTEAPDGE
jgi:predicted nucleic acid-binding protein